MLERLKSDHRDDLVLIWRRLLSCLLTGRHSCVRLSSRSSCVLTAPCPPRFSTPCCLLHSFGPVFSWQPSLDSGSARITGGTLQSTMRPAFSWPVWRARSRAGW